MIAKPRNIKELLQDWDAHCERIQSATKGRAPIETFAEKEKTKKQLLDDIVLFKKTLFPHYCSLPDSKAHKMLNRELVKHKKITQFRKAFRGFAKSVDATIIMPIYFMLKGENYVCAIISENQDKAQVLLSSLQAELESNELLIYYFGKQVGYGKWQEESFLSKSGTLFKCFGINQSIHGIRYRQHRLSYAVADDFDKAEFAGNPKRVEKYAYEIHGNIKASFEGSEFKRLVIAQNHKVKDGVLSKLLSEMKNSPSTKIHTVNVEDKNGKPTWPERYDEEGIKELKAEYTPRAFRAEFMNSPSSIGGIIDESWVKYGKVMKWNKYPALFLHLDMSYTVNGDYKAGALVGFDTGKREIHVLDIFCKQCDTHQVMNYYYDLVIQCRKLGVPLIASYDSSVAQGAVFEPIWNEVAKLRGIFQIPSARNAPSKDKYLRIEATLSPIMSKGKVIFDKALEGLPDTSVAIDQLTTVDKGTSGHDDFPDALEDVVRKAQTLSLSKEELENMKPLTGKSTLGRRGNRRGRGKGF